jgi:Na+-translocating ferredoxin:NAD+ oxidoreductase subunit E
LNSATSAVDGLWRNNPGVAQLLGLCPLLAVSNSLRNALGLGLATLIALMCSNAMISLVRRWVRPEIRIAVFVVIIAATVSVIERLMQAYWHDLYQVLGLFLPLIVTNCAIIARAEAYASRMPLVAAAFDGLWMGLGFLAVLLLIGGMRQALGGSLPLLLLPTGGFIVLALLVALKQAIDQRVANRT